MEITEWYKKEQQLLIEANLPLEAKDYIQGVLDRSLLEFGLLHT